MNDPIRSSDGTGEDRRERMQRIRVGLTGLAVVLLIVFVATAVLDRMRTHPIDADSGNGTKIVEEPLAELGATPGAASENTSGAPATKP